MSIQEHQREMQRKLGRCMLRLQQYERLLKTMVASMSIAGPLEQLQAVRDKQAPGVQGQTLGMLVGMFTGQYLAATSQGKALGLEEDMLSNDHGLNANTGWASARFTIAMSPERHSQTKMELAELVALRNDLVHHFIERFDISSEIDCRAACSYLDSCYERIDEHFQRLRTWACSVSKAQVQISAFVQSTAFDDGWEAGLNPEGTACSPWNSVVECLRNAEAACQKDGWTPLDAAIRLISKENQGETPGRYGCKTWRQVLRKSRQFEIRNVPGANGANGAKGCTWYRSNTKLNSVDSPEITKPH